MTVENKRTLADLQQEYSQLCSTAGHLEYQIFALQSELDSVNNALQSISLEAGTAKSNNETATVDSLQQEYNKQCGQAGHLGYQVFALKIELGKVYESLKTINLEGAAIKAKEAEASNEQAS